MNRAANYIHLAEKIGLDLKIDSRLEMFSEPNLSTAGDMVDAVEFSREYELGEFPEPYIDFAEIVRTMQKREESGVAFTQKDLPEEYEIEDLEGIDYGFTASGDYGNEKVMVEYREKDKGMFGEEEIARATVMLENEEEEWKYSTFWNL